MTTIAYIFLDPDRSILIPMVKQQEVIEKYASTHKLHCSDLLVEEKFPSTVSFAQRNEGKRILENVSSGDVVIALKAEWILGSPKESLTLLTMLKEKGVSLHCVDLDGDIVLKTARKLRVSEGIAPLVYELCRVMSVSSPGSDAGFDNERSRAIRAGKARKRRDGKYMGGPVPFGYCLDDEERLRKDEAQQAIISEMKMLKEDRWSYRNIAKKLREEHGLTFSHEGVRRILLKDSADPGDN